MRRLAVLVLLSTVVSYLPGASSAGAQAEASATDASLRLDSPVYAAIKDAPNAAPDCVGIRVTDPDEDRDAVRTDGVQVTLASLVRATGALRDAETLTLTETGKATGVFEAGRCVGMKLGAASNDNHQLEVEHGDMVVAVYLDPDNPPLPTDEAELRARAEELLGTQDIAMDSALVAGGPTGNVSVKFDPSLLPQDLRSIPVDGGVDLPVAAVLAKGGHPSVFVGNEVLVASESQEELDAFLTRWNGTILRSEEFGGPQPEPPTIYHAVRIDPSAVDADDLAATMAMLGSSGAHTFSSEDAARLMHVVLTERLGGLFVMPHLIGFAMTEPMTSEKGRADGARNTRGWRDHPNFFSDSFRVKEAGMMLDLLDRNGARSVKVAIIDSGFAGPNDYPAGDEFHGATHPDYGRPFNTIEQANCAIQDGGACRLGTSGADGETGFLMCAGGRGGACDWHGFHSWSIAGAVMDNGEGSIGVGGHGRTGPGGSGPDGVEALIDPVLLRTGSMLFLDIARAVRAAISADAEVISISAGLPCEPLLDIDLCKSGVALAVNVVCSGVAFLLGALFAPLGVLMEIIGCGALKAFTLITTSDDPMREAIAAALRSGIPVFAAGPEPVALPGGAGPHDAVDVEFIPCVITGVTCVGFLHTETDPGRDGDGDGDRDVLESELRPARGNAIGRGVDIWAPGRFDTSRSPNGTSQMGGTSAATPYTAGVAAMMIASNPGLPGGQIEGILRETSGALNVNPPGCSRTSSGRCVGHVDALAAVREASGVVLRCDGWDEFEEYDTGATNNDDHESRATTLAIAAPGAGGIEHVIDDTDNAIHDVAATELGTGADQDYFRIPAPSTTRNYAVRASVEPLGPGSDPRLDLLVDKDLSPSGTTLLVLGTGTTVEGSWATSSDDDLYVRVFGAAPAAASDGCYALRIELARLPSSDSFDGPLATDRNGTLATAAEVTSAWVHSSHGVCSRSWGTSTDCTDVFADVSAGDLGTGRGAAPMRASEFWSREISPLTLRNETDTDFYRFSIPDPSDPADGGHDDVDPGSDVEPLEECASYERAGLFGVDTIDTTTRITIEAIPESNSLSERPISGAGEEIHVYIDGVRRDDLASGTGLRKSLYCPRDRGFTELAFSIGERGTPRSALDDVGGYRIQLGYGVAIERSPAEPPFLMDRFGGMPDCFDPVGDRFGGITPPGGDPRLQPPPGTAETSIGLVRTDVSYPRDDFPYCTEFPGNPWIAYDAYHPAIKTVQPCERCSEYKTFEWADTQTLDMVFVTQKEIARPEYEFQLYTYDSMQISTADEQESFIFFLAATELPQLDVGVSAASFDPDQVRYWRLRVQDLQPGRYVLRISGPEAPYYMVLRQPDLPTDADGDGIADAWDLCAGEAEDVDGFLDGDGCADLDNDEDGVLDVDDNCPIVANADQADFDGDGLGDVCDDDADDDGLLDVDEAEHGTDPLDPDTDDDDLLDGAEVHDVGSDPLDPDTDGDLFGDGTEVAAGSDPTNPLSVPTPAGPVTVTDPPPVNEIPVTDDLDPIG